MIRVKIYRNNENDIYGFQLSGHAGYANEGSDVVCSAVTILVFNTINCLELYTEETFICDLDEEKGGFIDYSIPDMKSGKKCHDAQLLLKAMVNGLKDIKNEYSCYININDEEVQ